MAASIIAWTVGYHTAWKIHIVEERAFVLAHSVRALDRLALVVIVWLVWLVTRSVPHLKEQQRTHQALTMILAGNYWSYCNVCGERCIPDDLTKHSNTHEEGKLSNLVVRFSVSCRARQLWGPWQNHILAELDFYMDSSLIYSVHLDKEHSLLLNYEPLERCSLLELAVWKACCISRARDEVVGPSHFKIVGDVLRFDDKQRDSWKDFRKEMRSTNAIWIALRMCFHSLATHRHSIINSLKIVVQFSHHLLSNLSRSIESSLHCRGEPLMRSHHKAPMSFPQTDGSAESSTESSLPPLRIHGTARAHKTPGGFIGENAERLIALRGSSEPTGGKIRPIGTK